MTRSEDLESLYESINVENHMKNYYSQMTEEQIDHILMFESLDATQEKVIEELFGKTKAKLAGTKAKMGAQASNMKNRATTSAKNLGAKTGAVASNVGNVAKNLGKQVTGQYQTGDQQAGQVALDQVGNDQAQQVDPNQAEASAKLNSILPEIKKTIQTASQTIDGNLQSLGLDYETLNSVDPDVSKALKYAQGWLKAAFNKLG